MFTTSVSGFLAILPFIVVIYRAYTKMEKRQMAYKLKKMEKERVEKFKDVEKEMWENGIDGDTITIARHFFQSKFQSKYFFMD